MINRFLLNVNIFAGKLFAKGGHMEIIKSEFWYILQKHIALRKGKK